MKGMIHLKRRVTVAILAFAMVIAMLPWTAKRVEAAPTPSPAAYLDLIAVNPETNAPLTSASLELGDEVVYQLVTTADLDSAPIGMISGYLNYPSDYFEQVVNSDFTPAEGWTVYWDAPTQRFSIQTSQDDTFATGAVVCSIRMRVRRAVEVDVAVSLVGDLTNGNQPIEIRQHNNSNENVLYANNITRSLSNTVGEGARVFEMEIPQAQVFYTNSPANSKIVKVPISITNGSLYAGFRIAFTYNSSLVDYEGYELSQTAGAYVQMITQSEANSNSALVTRNIALVSSRDINQPGEFLYLKFKTVPGVSPGVGGANITITLYEAVNQSRAPMTYKLTGAASHTGTTTGGEVLSEDIALTFTTRNVVRGDVNNDGRINLVDALLIMQHYNGVRELSTVEGINEIGTECERADVNASGTVTLVDALLILKYYNGEITNFPNSV